MQSQENHHCFCSPLHLAAMYGDVDILLILIFHGFKINQQTVCGHPIITSVVQNTALPKDKTTRMLKTLAAIGVKMDWTPDHPSDSSFYRLQTTPVILAIRLKNNIALECLLELGANKDWQDERTEKSQALHVAGKEYNMGAAFLPLKHGATECETSDKETPSPFYNAVMQGSTLTVRLLLNAGANPNDGEHCLWDCEYSDGTGSASICDGSKVLHHAVMLRHLDMTRLLLSAGAKQLAGCEGRTPLFEAVSSRDHNLVRLLLKAGADVNHNDDKKHTPLHLAVKAIRTQSENNSGAIINSIQILLDAGAIQKKDGAGRIPLHYAAKRSFSNNLEVLQLLFRNVRSAARSGTSSSNRPSLIYNRAFRAAARESLNIEILKVIANSGVRISERYAMDALSDEDLYFDGRELEQRRKIKEHISTLMNESPGRFVDDSSLRRNRYLQPFS